MEKESKDKIIYISVPSIDKIDVEERSAMIDKLLVSETFTKILKDVLPTIVEEAITEDKEEVSLFRWLDSETKSDVDYGVSRKDYKKLLERILKFHEEAEEYPQCIKINRLINIL